MVGQGGRRGNNENDKISWYLRSCVDDLRNGIERENLQPEKLVQTTENVDIKINYIQLYTASSRSAYTLDFVY
jgi:hypothetical protein